MDANRTRAISWKDPMATAGAAKGKTGMAFLKAILAGEVPPAPIQFTLGFDLAFIDDGVARFTCNPGEHLYNPMAGVHGGVTTTLLDSAMGCAVMTTLDEKTGYTTIGLNMNLTRPITARTGLLTAEGKIVNRGSRVVTAEGKLTDPQGRLLAHATTTCLLIERE